MTPTPTSGAADLPEALRLAAAISNLLCSNEAAARTLAAAADELVRLHAESEMRRAALLDEMQKAAPAPPAAQAEGWISVDERLPKPGTPVLLDIGKKFTIRALWAEKHTVRVGTDVDDWGEYDEETDEYYCPEGWYEWNEHEEVHWAVSETPRAWRELPQPLPAAPGPADGESNG